MLVADVSCFCNDNERIGLNAMKYCGMDESAYDIAIGVKFMRRLGSNYDIFRLWVIGSDWKLRNRLGGMSKGVTGWNSIKQGMLLLINGYIVPN